MRQRLMLSRRGPDTLRAWETDAPQVDLVPGGAHGTHGTNCTGTCALNVYVKNGIVWREEQQGEYGRSEDAPDYGPRGCQKGLRHAKYMYGKQRILYPMKRVGERGEGKWERVTWDQALAEIADRFIDYSAEFGPRSISFDLGTQMVLKRASSRHWTVQHQRHQLPRRCGRGDCDRVQMTVVEPLLGDTWPLVQVAVLLVGSATRLSANPERTSSGGSYTARVIALFLIHAHAMQQQVGDPSRHASRWPGMIQYFSRRAHRGITFATERPAVLVRAETGIPALGRFLAADAAPTTFRCRD